MEIGMAYTLWEPYEIEFLTEVSETMPLALISEKLERPIDSIRKKAKTLGLKTTSFRKPQRWTDDQVALFDTHTIAEVAAITGRTYENAWHKRSRVRQQLAA